MIAQIAALIAVTGAGVVMQRTYSARSSFDPLSLAWTTPH